MLMTTVSVLIGRRNGQIIMDEDEVESYEMQGRVGRSWQQVIHEADMPRKKKQKTDIRGEGDTFDDMG